MRTFFLLAFALLLPSSAFTQTVDAAKFDELRRQRPEIRTYFESLATRNLANRIADTMARKGFTDDEIQKVLRGRAFAGFSRKVLRDPRVNESLDRFLDRLLAPGVLERMVQEKATERAAAQRAAMAQAVEELLRHRVQMRAEELEKPPLSIWQRLWNYLSRDLL